MCAIVGSFDVDKVKELVDLNAYRGQHSYSIAEYFPSDKKIVLHKRALGAFDISDVKFNGGYVICHTQAPTTDARDLDNVHPSEFSDSYLWHNGIIKDKCVKELQETWKLKNVAWDTKLIHVDNKMGGSLSDIDGTFSCLMFDKGELFLFRNKISPMFIDSDFNISSTKFEGAKKTDPEWVYAMDFKNYELVETAAFATKENPYFFLQ